MKLLTQSDLWCSCCKNEIDAGVELMAALTNQPGLVVCPTCLFQAIGLLGVKVDIGSAQAFELMRLTMAGSS